MRHARGGLCDELPGSGGAGAVRVMRAAAGYGVLRITTDFVSV